MARRIKEEPIVHQNRIAEKAMVLFAKKGIENTKMDEIAAAAGYGKATLYVYFKNKEDIVSFLSLKSMEKLKELLSEALENEGTTKEQFLSMCNALVKYQADYPDFFDRSLQYIQVEKKNNNEWLSKTYQVGEEVNQIISQYIKRGIESGELAQTRDYFGTILLMWGMISGIIKLAFEKEEYIRIRGNVSKEEFLKAGFEKIYQAIMSGQ